MKKLGRPKKRVVKAGHEIYRERFGAFDKKCVVCGEPMPNYKIKYCSPECSDTKRKR